METLHEIKDRLQNLLKDEHDLVLFDTELNDIIVCVLGQEEYTKRCNDEIYNVIWITKVVNI